MTPRSPIIEQQHKVRRVITFPSGKLTVVPVTTETSTIDPTTGERTLYVDEHRYHTADGRNVKPDEIAACTKCQELIAPQATSFCETCQAVLCRDCAQQPPRCTPCRKKDQRQHRIELLGKAIAWLCSR